MPSTDASISFSIYSHGNQGRFPTIAWVHNAHVMYHGYPAISQLNRILTIFLAPNSPLIMVLKLGNSKIRKKNDDFKAFVTSHLYTAALKGAEIFTVHERERRINHRSDCRKCYRRSHEIIFYFENGLVHFWYSTVTRFSVKLIRPRIRPDLVKYGFLLCGQLVVIECN